MTRTHDDIFDLTAAHADAAHAGPPAVAGTRTAHGADPWWGIEADPDPVAISAARVAGQRVRRPRPRRRQGLGWTLLGLLLAPLVWLVAKVRRSPRLRRYVARGVIVLGILFVLACSVGVILTNNVVIGRTAELGRLDDERGELRREIALLGEDAAKLSTPPLVKRKAATQLGMVEPSELPKFVYVEKGSRQLTDRARLMAAARVARERAAAEAADQADADAAVSGDEPAITTIPPDDPAGGEQP